MSTPKPTSQSTSGLTPPGTAEVDVTEQGDVSTRAWQGGCQCGQVRYALAPGKYRVYACHCLECQKQSASAFALSLPVSRDRFALRGSTVVYARATDSGTTTQCHYCPSCGVRLYHCSARSTDMLTIKAGTLDHAGALTPVAHLWVSRKQPWLKLPDDVPAFATQPDDLRAWRESLIARTSVDQ